MSYCGTNATTSRGQGQSREGAWERVKPNQRAGGVDEESIEAFGEKLDERLDQLHEDLRTGSYTPRHSRAPAPRRESDNESP